MGTSLSAGVSLLIGLICIVTLGSEECASGITELSDAKRSSPILLSLTFQLWHVSDPSINHLINPAESYLLFWLGWFASGLMN